MKRNEITDSRTWEFKANFILKIILYDIFMCIDI